MCCWICRISTKLVLWFIIDLWIWIFKSTHEIVLVLESKEVLYLVFQKMHLRILRLNIPEKGECKQ